MGQIAAAYDLMPESTEVDLDSVINQLPGVLPEGVRLLETKILPVAVGPVKVNAMFLIDDNDKEVGTKLEQSLHSLDGIENVKRVSNTPVHEKTAGAAPLSIHFSSSVLPIRFEADCAPCIMRRVLFQSRLIDNGLEFVAVKETATVFSEMMDSGLRLVEIATEAYRKAYAAIRSEDPYKEIKVRADEVAKPFMERLDEDVMNSENPLRAAVMAAAVGNIMDFGDGSAISDPDEFLAVFDGMMAQGLSHDDTDLMREILERTSTVVYIFDNCGESQLDKVLIRQLRRMGKRVVGVVRGAPILNDVTLEDAERIGLNKELDRLLTTGKFCIGFDWYDMPEDLVEEISGCGLIIAKGMANLEASSDIDPPVPMAHILRTKCVPVARALGVGTDLNVLKIRIPSNYSGPLEDDP